MVRIIIYLIAGFIARVHFSFAELNGCCCKCLNVLNDTVRLKATVRCDEAIRLTDVMRRMLRGCAE